MALICGVESWPQAFVTVGLACVVMWGVVEIVRELLSW